MGVFLDLTTETTTKQNPPYALGEKTIFSLERCLKEKYKPLKIGVYKKHTDI